MREYAKMMDEEARRNLLRQQLVDSHGKIQYTYTAHHKMVEHIVCVDKAIRVTQIILTAVSTGGFLATIITNQTILCWIGGIAAALSLGLNLYSKDFRLQEDARIHKDAADCLWDIREAYVSLLTDIDFIPIEDALKRRETLTEKTSEVNKKYPGTDKRSFRLAQEVIKNEKLYSFERNEAEALLPQWENKPN